MGRVGLPGLADSALPCLGEVAECGCLNERIWIPAPLFWDSGLCYPGSEYAGVADCGP